MIKARRISDPFRHELQPGSLQPPAARAMRWPRLKWVALLLALLWVLFSVIVSSTEAAQAPRVIHLGITRRPSPTPIALPTETATPPHTEQPMPTATRIYPTWLTLMCIYNIEQMVQQEVGDLANQKASDFVAAQIVMDAYHLQNCNFDRTSGSTLSKRWWLVRRLIPDEITAMAVNVALMDYPNTGYMGCALVGSLEDMMTWKAKRSDLRIGYSYWSADGRVAGVVGLNCSEGK